MAKKAAKTSNVPMWVWFFTGITATLFVAFIFYLTTVNNYNKIQKPATAKEEIQNLWEDIRQIVSNANPTKNYIDKPNRTTSNTTTIPTSTRESQDEKNVVRQDLDQYRLQVGSFKKHQDADGLRAKLILLGMKAKIARATVNGNEYHRVQIGPFNNAKDLQDIKQRLNEQHIVYLQIKAKS